MNSHEVRRRAISPNDFSPPRIEMLKQFGAAVAKEIRRRSKSRSKLPITDEAERCSAAERFPSKGAKRNADKYVPIRKTHSKERRQQMRNMAQSNTQYFNIADEDGYEVSVLRSKLAEAEHKYEQLNWQNYWNSEQLHETREEAERAMYEERMQQMMLIRDRKSTRLNSSHSQQSRMPSSA